MRTLLAIALSLFLWSCKKNDDQAPVITVTSPTNNQVFAGGQTVLVKATVSDNESIHMVHLTVTDNTTSGHLVHFEEHPDAQSYNLKQNFTPQSGRNYTIEIGATDHSENAASTVITVSAN